MKNTCWKLFSYLSIDREAAQDMLSGMANRGWELDRLFPGRVARFRRTDREDLRYFLDWTDPKNEEELDYLRLCEDAGWDFMQRVGYWNLYVSRPGFSPSPIQTDPETEYERFRGKVLRRMAIGAGITLAVLGFYVLALIAALTRPWVDLRFPFQLFYLESLCVPLFLLTLPLILAGGLAYLLLLAGWLWGWKRALEAGNAPPRAGAPEVWKVLSALCSVWLLLFYLFAVADTLLNDFLDWGYPVGLLLGGVILWCTTSDRGKRRRAIGCVLFGCLLLLAMALNGPFRAVFPGRLPPAPLVEGRYVDEEATQRRRDSFWGSSAFWWERCRNVQGQPDFQSLYSVSAQTWPTPVMAEKAAEREIRDRLMVPVEGQAGVWYGKGRNSYLLLDGKILLLIEHYDDGEPEALLDGARAWMDRIE